MPNYDSALVRVLKKAGGPTRVAEHLGLVPSAVTQWRRVPASHVPRLAAFTNIRGRDIRPDLYPPPEARPVAKPKRRAATKAKPKLKAVPKRRAATKAAPATKAKPKLKAAPKHRAAAAKANPKLKAAPQHHAATKAKPAQPKRRPANTTSSLSAEAA